MEKITHSDVSAEGFRFMAIREIELGFAPCLVGRVSFTGDLGFEIWMKPEYQRHVFDKLMEAGAAFNIKLFGLRALNAMRLEKSFGGWAREYRPLYGPLEAGLGRFIAYSKPADFIGKEAAIAERDSGGKLRLKMFVIEARDADVIGDEPIWLDGEVVGWVTSGGFAHNSGVSMALGYVPKEHANADGPWQIELLGERLAARVQNAPIWDANAERMRG
jgi:dimethylglycine dehydrogenase